MTGDKPSGHYMYHQFNIQQFYVLPTQLYFMCFVWISEQTAIISLYSIDWPVFITETDSVYCAVRPARYQNRNIRTEFTISKQYYVTLFCLVIHYRFLCFIDHKQSD